MKQDSCPKCRYIRKAMETAPAWQCPNCHIAYNKFGSPFSRETIKKTDDPSGIKWWHGLLSALFSAIFVGALWKMHFISHPMLWGLVLFGLVWAMLHTHRGGGSVDGDSNGFGNGHYNHEDGQGDAAGDGDAGD